MYKHLHIILLNLVTFCGKFLFLWMKYRVTMTRMRKPMTLTQMVDTVTRPELGVSPSASWCAE